MRRARVVAMMLVIGAGCGRDDAPDQSPPGRCRELVATVCAKYLSCNLNTADCVSQNEKLLECQRIVGVGPSFPQCLADLNALECTALRGAPPPSCNAVLTRR